MRLVALVTLALFALAGCETPAPKPSSPPPQAQRPPQPPPQPSPPQPPPKPVPPPKSPAEIALEEAVAQYDAGDYNKAIATLQGSKDIADGPAAVRVAAHKYMALSYCVTARRAQCRQQFVEALKLDPNFALEPAERTHPIWGPEYEAAKKSLASPAQPPKPATPKPKPPAG